MKINKDSKGDTKNKTTHQKNKLMLLFLFLLLHVYTVLFVPCCLTTASLSNDKNTCPQVTIIAWLKSLISPHTTQQQQKRTQKNVRKQETR